MFVCFFPSLVAIFRLTEDCYGDLPVGSEPPTPTLAKNLAAEESMGKLVQGDTSFAFVETFDGDPDSPSTGLVPQVFEYAATHRTHPQEHFTIEFEPFLADHDSSCNGPNPDITPLPQHYVTTTQDATGLRPDPSFYICKNHMMSSMGRVSPYSVSSFWPRQEFDFSVPEGTTKYPTIEFEVNINDGHGVRSWWEILIAPREQMRVGSGPTDSPISETYPADRIVFDFRRNVRTIKVGTRAIAPDGWIVEETQFGPWDYSWWHDLHPGDPATTDHRIRRKMILEFQQQKIVWKIETQQPTVYDEWQVDLPGPYPFHQGLVMFKTHAYNPTKDENNNIYTFHWDNIRFSGPIVGLYDVHEADTHVYLQRNGNRQVGESETVHIDIPEASLQQNPVLFGQVHHPVVGQVLLRVNGGPKFEIEPYAYEVDSCYSIDWQSFRLPLDPSLLVPGRNTLQWSIGPRPQCIEEVFEEDNIDHWIGYSIKFLQIQTDRVL